MENKGKIIIIEPIKINFRENYNLLITHRPSTALEPLYIGFFLTALGSLLIGLKKLDFITIHDIYGAPWFASIGIGLLGTAFVGLFHVNGATAIGHSFNGMFFLGYAWSLVAQVKADLPINTIELKHFAVIAAGVALISIFLVYSAAFLSTVYSLVFLLWTAANSLLATEIFGYTSRKYVGEAYCVFAAFSAYAGIAGWLRQLNNGSSILPLGHR